MLLSRNKCLKTVKIFWGELEYGIIKLQNELKATRFPFLTKFDSRQHPGLYKIMNYLHNRGVFSSFPVGGEEGITNGECFH